MTRCICPSTALFAGRFTPGCPVHDSGDTMNLTPMQQAATDLGVAMTAAVARLSQEEYEAVSALAVTSAEKDADGALTAAGIEHVTRALRAAVTAKASSSPTFTAR